MSASRRTDIPAYYSEWFFNRLKEGYLYAQNPINRKQISKVSLSKDVVDCIIFWTKNPAPMLDKLDLLDGYNYYFQFTLNSYDKKIEVNVPDKNELVKTFKALSDKIGVDKVIWRYDPLFCTHDFDYEYHKKYFQMLAEKLSGYTKRCVISFYDDYRNCGKNLRNIGYYEFKPKEMAYIAKEFVEIAKKYGISIETCAEDIDLDSIGIKHGKCIDDELIEKISGRQIAVAKDSNQRLLCGCVSSIDIGAYDSCPHNCLYCYANVNKNKVIKNYKLHNPNLPCLLGELKGDEKITDKKMKSLFEKLEVENPQGSFLD